MSAIFTPYSYSKFESKIFTYDDPENAKGLHVVLEGKTKEGQKWAAREVIAEDIPLYQELFADEKLMKYFRSGKPRSKESTKSRLEESWIPRFKNGTPRGALTLYNPENKEEKFGFFYHWWWG